jgi:hypothetical protein
MKRDLPKHPRVVMRRLDSGRDSGFPTVCCWRFSFSSPLAVLTFGARIGQKVVEFKAGIEVLPEHCSSGGVAVALQTGTTAARKVSKRRWLAWKTTIRRSRSSSPEEKDLVTAFEALIQQVLRPWSLLTQARR